MCCSICRQCVLPINEDVALQSQTGALLLLLRFGIGNWGIVFVLSSEKMDFYDNVQIFKNVATS